MINAIIIHLNGIFVKTSKEPLITSNITTKDVLVNGLLPCRSLQLYLGSYYHFYCMSKEKMPFRKKVLGAVAAVGIMAGAPSGKVEMGGYEITFAAEAAGIKGTDSPEYKKQVKQFYMYLLDPNPKTGDEFHGILKREGNLMKVGDVGGKTISGPKFDEIVRRFPALSAKNIKKLTYNLNKIDNDTLLITTILLDDKNDTNTNTITSRRGLGRKEGDEE